jgi:hypothetical protein
MDRNSKGGFRQVTEYSFFPSCKYWMAILWMVNSQCNACFLCRTDNAVKNRFSTLRKKREKSAALEKENIIPYIDSNSKRNISHQGYNTHAMSESSMPVKKMRYRALLSIRILNFSQRKVLTYYRIAK